MILLQLSCGDGESNLNLICPYACSGFSRFTYKSSSLPCILLLKCEPIKVTDGIDLLVSE